MTQFLDDPADYVASSIDALVRASGGLLQRLDGYPEVKVVRRTQLVDGHVALISGGGAGHEPTHAGFVGTGLLTAAVSGEIFASPSVEAVLAACKSVDAGGGCLLIVKNYTGDRLNFGLAAERARADGHRVELVIVSDDIAIDGALQPRGLAGTLFVHKIAGAAAEAGADLAEVGALAREVSERVCTLGVSMSVADIPGRAPVRAFAPGTAELGFGIHGEPGTETVDVGFAKEMVDRIAGRLETGLPASVPVAVLVNNLGGISTLELGVVVDRLLDTGLGRRVELLVGPMPLMTSLNMKGFSISALPLDQRIRAGLLAPYEPRSSWPVTRRIGPVEPAPMPVETDGSAAVSASDNPLVRSALFAVCEALLEQRGRLDALDARTGDGDTGTTFAAAARRILAEIDSLPLDHRGALLRRLGELVSVSMGGSSGVLISIMLIAAATSLERGSELTAALQSGAEAMQRYGGAAPGDRTMLDALLPALTQLSSGFGISAAAKAAAEGAAATATIETAAAGRSAYVPAHHLRGHCDPGAEAISIAFAGFASVLD